MVGSVHHGGQSDWSGAAPQAQAGEGLWGWPVTSGVIHVIHVIHVICVIREPGIVENVLQCEPHAVLETVLLDAGTELDQQRELCDQHELLGELDGVQLVDGEQHDVQLVDGEQHDELEW